MKYFNHETSQFFFELSQNNNKVWFNANRDNYEQYVLGPAIKFVEDLGAELQKKFPKIQAVPKVDQSIFRLHRDVRFGVDKQPYKTQLAILFWEGDGHRMQCPGAYFQIDEHKILIGGGCHKFNNLQLKAYRNRVVTPSHVQLLNLLSHELFYMNLLV